MKILLTDKENKKWLHPEGKPVLRPLALSKNGGPGSGNHGHSGRPGAVGGSGSGIALAPLDNLNPTGGLHVDYTPQDRINAPLGGTITTIDKTIGGAPDDKIIVYRGAPENQKVINPGDFITTSRELAASYTGEGNILSKEVRKGDVLDDANEPLGDEYIYRPNADKELKRVEKKANNEISAHDIPNLYENIDVDTSLLGALMLDTEIIPVKQYVKGADKDLQDIDDPLPAETEAHVTLLDGFLQNAHTLKDEIAKLLEGWDLKTITIEKVSYFKNDDGYIVVALIKKTDELIDGHDRLTLLPHMNLFSEYKPHLTLAYLKPETKIDKWVKALDKKYIGQKVAIKGLNYGRTVEEDKEKAKTSNKTSVQASISHDCSEHEHNVNSSLEKATNALEQELRDNVVLSESALLQSAQGLEADMANAVIKAVRDGDYNLAEELLTDAQLGRFKNQFKTVLLAYYLGVYPIYGNQVMQRRMKEYDMQGVLAMTNDVQDYITVSATNASNSHIETVYKDLQKSVAKAHDTQTQNSLIEIIRKSVDSGGTEYLKLLPDTPNLDDIREGVKNGDFDGVDGLYKRARTLAREGEGLEGIARAVKNDYPTISKNRATTIARHEANRVFNMAQFQADEQFLVESNLMDNAYKVLRNRADDPCMFCNKIIEETEANPIPFRQDFAELGSTITVNYINKKGQKAVGRMPISYESISAGNVHVNCRCEYVLLIKQEDGTFLNNLDSRIDNGGPGSGNHGHSGRPGMIGGSGSGAVDKKPVKEETKDSDLGNKSPKEASGYLKKKYSDTEYNIKESKAIDGYAGVGYAAINGGLRRSKNGGVDPKEFVDISLPKTVEQLDKSFKTKLKESTITYRGARNKRNQALKVAQVIKDPGYISTSMTRQSAEGFLGKGDNTPYIMKITIPKGQKVIIPSLSKTASKKVAHESEILLPRNSAMKVDKITKKKHFLGYAYNEIEVSVL